MIFTPALSLTSTESWDAAATGEIWNSCVKVFFIVPRWCPQTDQFASI